MVVATHLSCEVKTPDDRFTGAGFQDIVNRRCKELKELRLSSIGLYGVMASVVGVKNGRPETIVRRSFPDFEGAFDRRGIQTIFDTKVESSASFALSRYGPGLTETKRLQLTKMYDRAEYGCPCFFLIHWNKRKLKKRTDEAVTYAFPVSRDHCFWQGVERGEEKSINRSHCEEYGYVVPWSVIRLSRSSRARGARPDVLLAVRKVHEGASDRKDAFLGAW